MTERYYIEAARDGWDIMDGDTPIRDTDITARLNEQDDDIQRLRAENARLQAEVERQKRVYNELLQKSLATTLESVNADKEIARLRAKKSGAHTALGALYSAVMRYYVNMARRVPAGELDPISECRVISEHQHAKIVAAMDAAQRFALDYMHAQNAARAATTPQLGAGPGAGGGERDEDD